MNCACACNTYSSHLDKLQRHVMCVSASSKLWCLSSSNKVLVLQVSKGTLSVATQTSGFDARPAGKGPAALALLSLKQRMSARDGAAPAEACFIPAGE